MHTDHHLDKVGQHSEILNTKSSEFQECREYRRGRRRGREREGEGKGEGEVGGRRRGESREERGKYDKNEWRGGAYTKVS